MNRKLAELLLIFGLCAQADRLYQAASTPPPPPTPPAACVQLEDQDAGTLNDTAYERIKAGNPDQEALDEVNEAIRQDPGVATFYDTRGYLYLRQGDAARALPDLEKGVQGERRQSHLRHLSEAYRQLGRGAEAAKLEAEAMVAPVVESD